jgi:hypothetical protein
MQGLWQSDKKEYEIPITNCMKIFIFPLAKFCYMTTKKKPLQSVQRDFLEKMHLKTSSYFEGKNVRSCHI